MPNVSDEILKKITEFDPGSLPFTAEMIAPQYGGMAISNLPATICEWLGTDPLGWVGLDKGISNLPGSKFRQVILVVVDGLGWEQYQRFSSMDTHENQRWQELIQDGSVLPLTSIVPSTTAAALTSFWTGLPPAGHGITGYEMWLQEYGITANMILQSPASFTTGSGSLVNAGFRPDRFLQTETLGPFLRRNGVHPYALQHNSITRSGLSQMLLAQVEALPFRTISDMWWTLEQIQGELTAEKRYSYVYWGELDELQHVYGPDDPRVAQEYFVFLRALTRFLQRARAHGNGDTLFLLTADHGQVPSTPLPELEIRRYPELLKGLHLLPTGESRMPYLYLRPGCESRTLKMIAELFPGQFIPVDSNAALEAGLFGQRPFHEQILPRIGDVVLFAREDHYLWWPEKENLLRGRHGGLNRREMIVPLVMMVV